MAETAVALEDLYPVGSWACAHRKGEPVPFETGAEKRRVADQGWDELVRKPSDVKPADLKVKGN